MTEHNKLSTTQLAKKRGIAQNQFFAQLNGLGLILKDNDKWVLSEAGERLGGVYLTGQYGLGLKMLISSHPRTHQQKS